MSAPDPFADDDPTERVVADIFQERVRQVVAEHHLPYQDDGHVGGQLARMAAAHIMRAVAAIFPPDNPNHGVAMHRANLLWPGAVVQMRSHDQRRHLVIAGALLVAEIERLDRAAAAATPAEDDAA